MRTRSVVSVSVLAVAGLVLGTVPAHAATAPPHVLAATGDSITRAFDVNGSHYLKDDPAESWSTGTDTAVNSLFLRLGGASVLTAYNDAVTGTKMASLDGQLQTAAAQQADGVTIEMGANDLCTSSAGTMTPTATFQAQFATALTDFTKARPGATISVSSIPNIYQLWSALHGNPSARFIWALFGECKSMLASSNTEALRQKVVTQEQADNDALARVCATFPTCHWDGGAVFGVKFDSGQVSTVDYFHPNVSGQNTLAKVAWGASPWVG